MKQFFAILLSAAAVLACTKTSQEAARLEVGETEILVPAKANIALVNVTSNGDWTTELSEGWVVPATRKGTGSGVLKLAVMDNKDYSAREAVLTLTSGTVTKTVRIVQSQFDGLFVDGDEVAVPYEGTTIEIPVRANVSYTATTDVDWMTIIRTKALEDGIVSVQIPLNVKRDGRSGHVTISDGGSLTKVVTVNQGAFEPFFNLVDEQGVGPWGTLVVPKEGITYTFTAETNMEFYAEAPDADWITVTKEGNVVTVTIPENADSPRTEYIYMGCSLQGEDYSDYGAMIQVKQKGLASLEQTWTKDFYWAIFPNSTRVSIATAGDYLAMYSPGAVTPGIHLINRSNGNEEKVLEAPVAHVTGITNDDAGHVIVTTGGNFPLKEDWSLDEAAQIPLQVYVMSEADFLDGNYGNPILTYRDGFYGYGLDNARVTGDATGDAVLAMTSGAAGGGTYSVAWEIKGGATTDTPTVSAVSPSSGGDLWDSFHAVTLGCGTTVNNGFYFAGYVGDYNVHYNPAMTADGWKVAFKTGYTWEGAVNAGDVFTYEGETYAAIVGMNYFSFADWDYDGVVDGYMPGKLWILKLSDPGAPELAIDQEYYATEGNWQYGSNADVRVVAEDGKLMVYLMDAAASSYRKFELSL
jgi:hypothetical protein